MSIRAQARQVLAWLTRRPRRPGWQIGARILVFRVSHERWLSTLSRVARFASERIVRPQLMPWSERVMTRPSCSASTSSPPFGFAAAQAGSEPAHARRRADQPLTTRANREMTRCPSAGGLHCPVGQPRLLRFRALNLSIMGKSVSFNSAGSVGVIWDSRCIREFGVSP